MFTRDEQIKLLETMEERLQGYADAWIADPAFRAALHRYDRRNNGNDNDGVQPRRAYG